jgi:predicted GNAT family acetyltransferase
MGGDSTWTELGSSQREASQVQIQHDVHTHRFTAELSSGTAVLSYAPAGEDVLDFFSTYVPPADRGRNVAAQLVEAALAYARIQGFRVIPTCWYVDLWIRRHPEHADLIVR